MAMWVGKRDKITLPSFTPPQPLLFPPASCPQCNLNLLLRHHASDFFTFKFWYYEIAINDILDFPGCSRTKVGSYEQEH